MLYLQYHMIYPSAFNVLLPIARRIDDRRYCYDPLASIPRNFHATRTHLRSKSVDDYVGAVNVTESRVEIFSRISNLVSKYIRMHARVGICARIEILFYISTTFVLLNCPWQTMI